MNPNMRNVKLRAVCEELGLQNVKSVVSSGNIVFESGSPEPGELESLLESAWPERLGFASTTIVRSRPDLETLIDLAPFGEHEHGRTTYLLVTFAKHPVSVDVALPHRPAGTSSELVGATAQELFTVTDTTAGSSLDAMTWLEQVYGKNITSRTWLTVLRILKKMRA